MKINSNIPALNANRLLGRNTKQLGRTLERLSSGKGINRASDDAAGMAISEKMKAQIKGLRQASRNSLDGISMIQTAEGALNEVHDMLKRMRELSVQGANGIYDLDDLNAIVEEMDALTDQIQDISDRTDFNGIKILTGKKPEANRAEGVEISDEYMENLYLQVGAHKGEHLSVKLEDLEVNIELLGKLEGEGMSIKELNNHLRETIEPDSDKKAEEEFTKAIKVYDNAITTISSIRGKLGAIQNRLETSVKYLDNSVENLTESMSRIEDVDMALEMTEFTRLQILQQSSTAMLGEANQLPTSVLQLLQG